MNSISLRRLLIISGTIVAGLATLAVCAGFAFYANPRVFTEIYIKHVCGHPISIAQMDINYHPLLVELHDVRVQNAPWGSKPDMVTIGHIKATPDFSSFFSEGLKFHSLLVEDANILLERNEQGEGNWKKRGLHITFRTSPTPVKSRRHFPTILDLKLHNSRLAMHTSGGNLLKVDLSNLHLQTADEQQPVSIDADGAYNDVPVHMQLKSQSYAVLHDIYTPFGIDIDGTAATIHLATQLQLMDPLNFDLFNGHLQAHIKKTGEAFAIFGSKFNWDVPTTLESNFERKGDDWTISDVTGTLADSRFMQSRVQLTEAGRKEPDSVQASLHFKDINIGPLLPIGTDPQKSRLQQLLLINDEPPILLNASLAAEQLSYRKLHAANVTMHATIGYKKETLDATSPNMAGGKFSMSVTANTVAKTAAAQVELSHANMQQIIRALGIDHDIAKTSATATLSANAKGNNLAEWFHSTQGNFRIALTPGKISRHLIQIASTDLRTLVHSDMTLIPLRCGGAVASFDKGMGVLSPFRIETSEGLLLGAGNIDLGQENVDLIFHTDPKTTSGLALDLPIHITGSFDDLHIVPGPKNGTDFTASQNTTCSS